MNIFSKIPPVHELLRHPQIEALSKGLSRETVVKGIRSSLEEIRKGKVFSLDTIYLKISEDLSRLQKSSFRPVINATGILIHTNLGRAPLSKKALQKVVEVSQGYSTLEFDLEKGKRGERNDHVEKLLCQLTGGQAALVVNNNAAALFLCLNTLAFQKNVLVSRGELVEIGSSFRIPDIMQKSGAFLKEVGTTNKTKLKDYDQKEADLFLKVHKSNYDIVGFTEEVSLKDLSALARKKKKILIFDEGSGVWESIRTALKVGTDLITFSGDKLLGGPQAGLIVGKKTWIDRLKKNPLYRILRVEKIVLAVLEETLRHYTLEHPEKEIPFLQLLNVPLEILEKRAHELKSSLKNIHIQIEKDISKVGGGSLPSHSLPTIVLSIFLPKEKLLLFEKKLRESDTPVIGRIHHERFILDLRTVFESELSQLKHSLEDAHKSIS